MSDITGNTNLATTAFVLPTFGKATWATWATWVTPQGQITTGTKFIAESTPEGVVHYESVKNNWFLSLFFGTHRLVATFESKEQQA